MLQGLRPGCDGVVYPGIRYTGTTDESQVPPPQKGSGAGARGAGSVQYNKKLVARI
ncbi:MAG TPA: hypothetical protein VN227_08980 [Methanoregula sp.]|nr:hypothetical protein [Methanoregula sp.]